MSSLRHYTGPSAARQEMDEDLARLKATRNKRIRAIKAAQRKHGLDDDTYRDMLERVTGKRSCTKMTSTELGRVLDHINGGRAAHRTGEVKQAGMIRALWISAWNLGVVRDREDVALRAFVKRQTGVQAERWLQHPGDANKVIEALKSWLTREARVSWEPYTIGWAGGRPLRQRNDRRRVVEAQWEILREELDAIKMAREFVNAESYGYRVTGKAGFAFYQDHDYDQLIAALGRMIRRELDKAGAENLRDWREQRETES